MTAVAFPRALRRMEGGVQTRARGHDVVAMRVAFDAENWCAFDEGNVYRDSVEPVATSCTRCDDTVFVASARRTAHTEIAFAYGNMRQQLHGKHGDSVPVTMKDEDGCSSARVPCKCSTHNFENEYNSYMADFTLKSTSSGTFGAACYVACAPGRKSFVQLFDIQNMESEPTFQDLEQFRLGGVGCECEASAVAISESGKVWIGSRGADRNTSNWLHSRNISSEGYAASRISFGNHSKSPWPRPINHVTPLPGRNDEVIVILSNGSAYHVSSGSRSAPIKLCPGVQGRPVATCGVAARTDGLGAWVGDIIPKTATLVDIRKPCRDASDSVASINLSGELTGRQPSFDLACVHSSSTLVVSLPGGSVCAYDGRHGGTLHPFWRGSAVGWDSQEQWASHRVGASLCTARGALVMGDVGVGVRVLNL